MNPILKNLGSRSCAQIFLLWSAYLALHAAGTPVPEIFAWTASLGLCFKEGCRYLAKKDA